MTSTQAGGGGTSNEDVEGRLREFSTIDLAKIQNADGEGVQNTGNFVDVIF